MEKTLRVNTSHKVMALASATALALSGLALSGAVNPVTAHAVSVEVSESTGILWGVDLDDNTGLGSYEVGTDTGTIIGYATTDSDQFPTSADEYSAPTVLDDLNEEQRTQLAVAFWISENMNEDGTASNDLPETLAQAVVASGIDIDVEEFLGGDLDYDATSAAVAGVIKTALDDSYDPSTMNAGVGSIYDLLIDLASNTEDNADNVFAARSVDGAGPDIISASDITVQAPVISDVTLGGDAIENAADEGDESPTNTTTDTETETSTSTPITTPVTVTPTRTTTTDVDEELDVQIRTSAGTQARNIVEEGGQIVDTVTFTGLDPEQEYRLVGETYYQGDNGSAVADGNTGEVTFQPDTPNGRIDVTIPLESIESNELVVFETLYDSEGNAIAEHKDITDRAQTVGHVPVSPELQTSVQTESGQNNIVEGMTVNDLVAYSGVNPGTSYRLEARLACKDTGEVYADSATYHDFVPEERAGEVSVDNIPVTDPSCDTQVVYEKLYEVDGDGEQGILVASHEDIDDMAQTFGADATSGGNNTGGNNQGGDTISGGSTTSGGEGGETISGGSSGESQRSPFANCGMAYDAGYYKIPEGSYGYSTELDQNGNGIACEDYGPTKATPTSTTAPAEQPRQTIDDVPSGSSTLIGSSIFRR